MNTNKEFNLKIEDRGLVNIFYITGYFSSMNVVKVRQAFEETQKKGCKMLWIVLHEIDLMDSMGLGLLVNINKKLSTENGSLLLINPNKIVKDVIELTGTLFETRSNIRNFQDITSIFAMENPNTKIKKH